MQDSVERSQRTSSSLRPPSMFTVRAWCASSVSSWRCTGWCCRSSSWQQKITWRVVNSGQCAEHKTEKTLGDIELSTNRHKYRVWSHLIHWGMGRFCFIFLASFCFMRKVFRADIMPTYFLSGKNDYLAFLCNCKQSYNERMVTILSTVTPSFSGLQNLKS